MDEEFEFNLSKRLTIRQSVGQLTETETEIVFKIPPLHRKKKKKKLTSQFVAVKGTREKIHPRSDCRSPVRRICLKETRRNVSQSE